MEFFVEEVNKEKYEDEVFMKKIEDKKRLDWKDFKLIKFWKLSCFYSYLYFYNVGILKDVVVVVWMVIFGDGIYNFCDGLVIGLVFVVFIIGGISIIIVVFCYELFYEIGIFYVCFYLMVLFEWIKNILNVNYFVKDLICILLFIFIYIIFVWCGLFIYIYVWC